MIFDPKIIVAEMLATSRNDGGDQSGGDLSHGGGDRCGFAVLWLEYLN